MQQDLDGLVTKGGRFAQLCCVTRAFSPAPPRLFTISLTRDFLEFHGLADGERRPRPTLFGVGKGPSVLLDAGLDRAQEFALPLRQLHAAGLGGAARLAQDAQGGTLGLRLAVFVSG